MSALLMAIKECGLVGVNISRTAMVAMSNCANGLRPKEGWIMVVLISASLFWRIELLELPTTLSLNAKNFGSAFS